MDDLYVQYYQKDSTEIHDDFKSHFLLRFSIPHF